MGSAPRSVRDNIQTIVTMEETREQKRSLTDRIADGIAGFAGTSTFVGLHLLWFATWAALNTGWLPVPLPKFDPYPFSLLCMLVSMEGVLLSTFVLIKQNRMGLRADRRAHLDLQVNLLTETEVTKLLQVMERIGEHIGLPGVADEETRELEKLTAVGDLASELDHTLPVDK